MKQSPLNEIFHFKCTCCGDCCSGSMEININIYDLYKMAVKMGFHSSGELFSKNYVKLVQVQNGSWTPQIKFKTQPYEFCPWIINDMGDDTVLRGYCSLHPHDKPLICKLAPVGRTVDFNSNDISYMLTSPTENCPGMDRPCQNRLSDIQRELKVELDWEYRYYSILEQLGKFNSDKDFMLRELYTFEITGDFEEIIKKLEEKSEILIE